MVLLADWIQDVREREASRTLTCLCWVTGRMAWRCHLKRGNTLKENHFQEWRGERSFIGTHYACNYYMASVD